MLTDTRTQNLRIVLHQIYVNLYVEFGETLHEKSLTHFKLISAVVVKNPLSRKMNELYP